MKTVSLEQKRTEFFANVWDHAADEFQAQFDVRRELSVEEAAFLQSAHLLAIDTDEASALQRLQKGINKSPDLIAILLQTCGLTRNKILGDLKASAASKGLIIPSNYRRLATEESWQVAGPYLMKRIRAVFGQLSPGNEQLSEAFEAVNQATWPGYIRQQRAKLSGHEAEYRLATLFFSLELPFAPKEKAENPLCRDAQIDNISFDLVAPNVSKPLVVVKSTVHTANIGQYGESKDELEMREARQWLDDRFSSNEGPTLLAFIDGIGFRGNRAGLDGVLTHADEFCQFQTIWKAALVGALRLDIPVQVALSAQSIPYFESFINRWDAGSCIVPLEDLATTAGWISAGAGYLNRVSVDQA